MGESGPHSVGLYDQAGRRLWFRAGMGPATYRVADIRTQAGLRPGVYLAKVTTPMGGIGRPLSIF